MVVFNSTETCIPGGDVERGTRGNNINQNYLKNQAFILCQVLTVRSEDTLWELELCF